MKKSLFFVLMVMLFLPLAMRGQTTVTIGTGTGVSNAPFQSCYMDSWSESIYTATEVGVAGTITEVSYNMASNEGGAYSTTYTKIYMGTRTSSTFASTTDWTASSNLTEVYSGPTTLGSGSSGWKTIQLTTPYVYDGVNNLVIVVVHHDLYSYNCSLYYYGSTNASQYMYRQEDENEAYAQHPGTSAGTAGSNRPNVQLTIITAPITCPAPSNVAVSGVNSDNATITWEAGGTESSWDIILSTTDITPDATTSADYTASTTTYTFTNLTSSTQYYAYVRANCGAGDVSVWESVPFVTSQIPAMVPYTQDWENETENAQWTMDTAGQTNKWYIGTGANNTEGGTQALYISDNQGTSPSYNITSTSNVWAYRDIDFGTWAEYKLSFDFKGVAESCCDYLSVYVGPPAIPSGNTTPAGATYLGRINQYADFVRAEFVLNSSYSGVQRVYLLWHNDGSVGTNPPAIVDNISIEATNCCRPYNLALDTTTTSSSLTFHFTPALPTDNSWEAVILAPGDTIDESLAVTLTDTTYTFTGLEANTLYTIYVRTNCGTESSYWSEELQGRTACPEYMEIPFTENFETYGTGSTSYYLVCWERMSTYGNYPYISSTNYSAPGSLYFYSSSSANNMIVMPAPDPSVAMNTLSMSFMFRTGGTTSAYALKIGVVENSVESTFTLIETITAETANEWQEFEIDFADYTGNGNQIAFLWEPGGSYSCYVDNVNVYYTPSCLKPMAVEATNITSNSVQIGWDARNSESSWQVVIVPHGADVATGTPENVNSNPYQVSGLLDNTQYDVYVKALCDDGSESIWSTPCTFYTKCLPTSVIPYIEDFQAYGMGNATNFPNCWTRHQEGTSTAYPYISSTGGGSLYFYSYSTVMSYGATQMLDLSTETPGTLILSFDIYKSSSSYGRMDVGYMTDADDISTFHLIKAIYPTDLANTSTWHHYEVVVPEAAYTSNVYFAFKVPMSGSSNYVYIDNVTVDYGCATPSNLIVSDLSSTSALVSWTLADGVTEYVLEYSEEGQDNWNSQIVTGNNAMISGLTISTSYDVMLYSSCGTSNSDTLTTTFTTSMLPIVCNTQDTLPTIDTTATASTNYMIPVNNYYRYTYSQQIYTAEEMGLAEGAVLSGIGFQYGYTVASTEKTNVTIYLAHTTVSSFASGSSWIPISTATQVYTGSLNCSQGWNYFEFDTPFQYNGTDNLVLIVDDNSGDYNSSSYVFNTHSATSKTLHYYNDSTNPDPNSPPSGNTLSSRNNVQFFQCTNMDVLTTCVAPILHVASVDSSSAEIVWAPGNDETSWELEYKLASTNTWISEGTVTTSPYLFTGLSSGTTYDVRMRTDCGDGEYSDWTTTSFTTVCYVLELPFMEDFEAAYTGATNFDSFLDCWNRKTNYSSQYPYCSSTQANSGVRSLYFYGTSTTYSLATTPRFDDSILMDTLQIQFMAYKTTSSYFIEVGIMSDPNDPNTFTVIGQASPSETSTWERFEINTTGYSGNGRYVAFRIPKWVTSYMYIDDVNIYYIPSCLHVEDIEANNITANSADITWDAGGSESTWEVLYGTNVDVNVDQPITVTTNSIALTDLLANTEYKVYVKSLCDNGQSSTWMTYTFRTACAALTTLPYTEDFESYTSGSSSNNVLPFCWDKINTGTAGTGYPTVYSSSSYASSGSKVLYFYTSTTSTYGDQYAILPEIDTDVLAINTMRLSLKARRYSTTTSYQNFVIVGVMTDNTDATTFAPVDTITFPTTTIERHYVDFTNYTGTGSYIAIMVPQPSGTYSYNYTYLDDITLDLTPACGNPTDISVTVTSATEAQITWNDEATESSWEVLVTPSNTPADFTQAQSVSTNSYTVSDLLGNTEYTVYIRTQCSNGNGYSEWTSTTFSTPSANPAQLPYYNGFEEATENAEWVIRNNSSGNKWFIGTPSGTTDNVLYVSGDNGASTSYTSTSGQVWVYRDIEMPVAAEFELSFKWSCTGESSFDYMYAYFGDIADVEASTSTALTAPAGTEQLGGNAHRFNANSTPTWFTQTFNASVGGGVKRLYFAWRNDGSGNYPPAIQIDSIIITAINCGRPYDLTLDAITPYTADLSFLPALNTDASWEYVITTADTIDPDDPSLSVTALSTTSIALANLTPATTYYVYVRTDCGGGEYSAWSEPVTIMTTCLPETELPYTENFDTSPTGSSATVSFVDCWDRMNTYSQTSNYPYVTSSSTAVSGGNVLYFYSSTSSYNIAIMNAIDVTIPMNTLRVSFMAKAGSSNIGSGFQVGVMTNPLDESTFVPVDTINFTTTSVWEEKEVNFNEYTGTGQYVAFRLANVSSGLYLDDVVLDVIPDCDRPTITDVTADFTSATVTISPSIFSTPIGYEYVYGTPGFDPTTATPVQETNTTFTITGLTNSTRYDLYVRTICGTNDVSVWSRVYVFDTECDLIDLPYSEDFDSYAGTTYSTAGLIPACWDNYSNNTSYPAPHITGSGSYNYPNSGTNALTFTASSAGADAIAILPEFSLPLNQLKLSFYYRMESATYGALAVGYVTDASSPLTTFTSVSAINSTTTITEEEVSFTDLTNVPAGARIAFKWTQNGTYYSCGIDDILVDVDSTMLSSCDAPTALAVSNVSQTGATATWTAGGEESAWNLQYKLASASDWGNSINVTAPTYTFTGLTANTAYQVRVQAVCDDATSDWTAAVDFTTLDETAEFCPAPTGLTATDVQNESITLTWEQEANTANSWEVQYRVQGSSTWNSTTATAVPYTLTGLTGLTTYEIQVVANCTNGLTSDPSNMITETTTNVGISSYDLESSVSLYPNPTSDRVTISAQGMMESVSMYDVYGKLISTMKVNDTNATVDLSSYASGVYFARITTENGVVTKRIVKK